MSQAPTFAAESGVAATFCATLVDEWVRAGVRQAIIAPGSRSTPLALALASRADLDVHVFHDERSASFAALGVGLASGVPAVLLCTSGTAATHFHGAIVEADQAEVPMIVCTADRPPELRGVSADQTIDQTLLYGGSVRWFHDPGVPAAVAASTWRALAARSVLDAMGPRPGPVHLNLPFREPLVGQPGELPPSRSGGAPWQRGMVGVAGLTPESLHELVTLLDRQRGIIVVGKSSAGAGLAEAVHELAERVGWPVLADPRSGCRVARPTTIAAFDDLLRHDDFANAHAPEVVIRIGTPPASKLLSQWLTRSGSTQVQVHGTSAWIDPSHTAALRIVADPITLCRALADQMVGAARTPWLARWRRAESVAQRSIDETIDAEPTLTEPGIARALVAGLPWGAHLVVSSSMPVRDVEWYSAPRDGLTIHANRGANGIDGVTSTAIGVALASGAPTALLIGDVAFLHDAGALIGLARRALTLTLVIVDNNGGGIFSFLPQATTVAAERFERLYGTPHDTDLKGLLAAHGLSCRLVATSGELANALSDPTLNAIVVSTDRVKNVAFHEAIHQSVSRSLTSG